MSVLAPVGGNTDTEVTLWTGELGVGEGEGVARAFHALSNGDIRLEEKVVRISSCLPTSSLHCDDNQKPLNITFIDLPTIAL